MAFKIFSKSEAQPVEEITSNDTSCVEEVKKNKEDEYIWVEGYKATNYDMTCRDVQFEMNKVFTTEDEPVLCKKGFHFCKDIHDVAQFYYYGRIFKVRAYVKKSLWNKPINDLWSDFDGSKYVAKSIEFIEELPISTCRKIFERYCLYVNTDEEYLEMIADARTYNDNKIMYYFTEEAGLVPEFAEYILHATALSMFDYKHKIVDFAVAIHKQGVSNDKKVELIMDRIYKYTKN